MLGCSEGTVWNRLRDGTLKRVRMGGQTRLNRAAVEAYAVNGDPPRESTRSPGAGKAAGTAQPQPRRPAAVAR